jgi:hypothetical protein
MASYWSQEEIMPYIEKKDRKKFEKGLCSLSGQINTPGELNYIITELLLDYIQGHLDYQHLNDCLGALEGAKLELYRRIISSYEDKKIASNSDVVSQQIKDVLK